jgi:hypothetical protein
MRLDIPDNADDEEAAAIAAVVRAHMRAQEGKTEAEGTTDRTKRRWRFSGRLDSLQNRNIRPPMNTPTGTWRAAGRAERMPHR